MSTFLILIFQSVGFTQIFQRNYGTPLDNSFSKVIKDGSDYYVLGQDEPNNGSLFNATVTRLNANGTEQWTLSLTIPSVWNDAVLTPSGELIVVGNTLLSMLTQKVSWGASRVAAHFNG